ncbi:MAG: dihydrofolate reductase family protein [Collinsella sp.]|nr:dihydrofolate reductase family protein [Collinsella sp.]
MTVHFYTSSTLDGFLATEDHSLAWLFKQDFDTEGPMAYPAFIERIGALAMGASTYRWLLEQDGPWPYAQPTWVFTHRELAVPEGADIRFVDGSPSDLIAGMEESAGGKDLWVVGGGGLATQFAEAGLLDEVWVQFAPVTLGSGRPLFTGSMQLDLLEVERNRDFVCTHYQVRKG